MSNIRVLIRDAPTMLRDILEQTISNEPDMEVMPEPVVPTPRPADQPSSPDVVIAGLGESDPGEGARALLVRWPSSHVLMITARGQKVLGTHCCPEVSTSARCRQTSSFRRFDPRHVRSASDMRSEFRLPVTGRLHGRQPG